jgi:hypothetical protein
MKTGELTRAVIMNDDKKGEAVSCLFNPSEYTVAKSNQWETRGAGKKDVPAVKFSGGGSRTMNLELLFDCLEDGNGNTGQRGRKEDVRDYTNKLWKLATIDNDLKDPVTGQGRPPIVVFQWGQAWWFKAVITSLSIRYTLFARDGMPVRAIASVSFQEVEDQNTQKGTNPTSEGLPGFTRRSVRVGDSLALIAYEEYGDAGAWRTIADENGLENPVALYPGQVLGIPPRPQIPTASEEGY